MERNPTPRGRAHRAVRAGALALTALGCASSATAQVDQELADRYFEEARVLCEREGGRLWGVSLCGPMAFADPVTRTIATNRPAPEGDRPPTLGYANSSVDWGGTRWATLVWPLPPDDARSRDGLMLHELFHRIQPELKLLFPEPKNDHLDTADGRYWLQLEWRALAKALGASGPSREEAIRHAVAFRAARRAEFPDAAENERILELQEGLAQYTGVVASTSTPDGAIDVAIRQLGREEWLTSLVRTFAYGSGTAYGLLLDAYSPGWTRRLEPTDDLGDLLVSASGLQPADDARAAAGAYGAAALRAAEDARQAEREAHIADLRGRFVEGPVLVLPDAGSYSFQSQGITPLGEHGSVYPTVRATSEWGELEAAEVLIAPDYRLAVPAPFEVTGDTIRGDGWTLRLAPGWVVRPGPRPRDRVVIHENPEAPSDLDVAFLDAGHTDPPTGPRDAHGYGGA